MSRDHALRSRSFALTEAQHAAIAAAATELESVLKERVSHARVVRILVTNFIQRAIQEAGAGGAVPR